MYKQSGFFDRQSQVEQNKCVDRNAVDILTREITYKKYVVAR